MVFNKKTGYKMADREVGYRGNKFDKKCFQRYLREKENPETPKQPLENIVVKEIDFHTAQDFILKYEWLGTMGVTKFSIGLYCNDILCGVACFGVTAGTAALSEPFGEVNKSKGIVLVRGACAPYAHEHAGSFLIGQCKTILREKGYEFVIAYSDPEAGEIGTLYQATNWNFYGFTSKVRYLVRPDGKRVDPKLIYKYAKKNGITRQEQKEIFLNEGYTFETGNKKLKYLLFVGDKRSQRNLKRNKKVKFFNYINRSTLNNMQDIYKVELNENDKN